MFFVYITLRIFSIADNSGNIITLDNNLSGGNTHNPNNNQNSNNNNNNRPNSSLSIMQNIMQTGFYYSSTAGIALFVLAGCFGVGMLVLGMFDAPENREDSQTPTYKSKSNFEAMYTRTIKFIKWRKKIDESQKPLSYPGENDDLDLD